MSELQVFKQTSDAPYDQNRYKVHFTNGKVKVFNDWESMFTFWWTHPDQNQLDYVDIQKKKHA